MRRAIRFLLLFWSTGLLAQNPAIKTYVLDDQAVRPVPISRTRVTTLLFPSPIQAISAVNVTTSLTNLAGFQLDFRPSSSVLSLRALLPNATGNLNVLWNGKNYVFELMESETPALSVSMQAAPSVKTLLTRPAPASPTRLVGLVQKAKSYRYLAEYVPGAVVGIERVTPHRVLDYGGYEIQIEEVFRFDPEDTLVFHLTLRNRTDSHLSYRGFSVRVGERVFHSALTDASGDLRSSEEQVAYFAISGSPSGGRNELSLKNQFQVTFDHTL